MARGSTKEKKATGIVSKSRNVRELETLYNISQVLITGGSQRQILAEVLDSLDSDLGMKRGVIMLLAPGGDEITIEVAHNLPDAHRRKVRYRMGEGVTGRVMQTGKAMVVPKVSQEPLFLNRFGRKQVDADEISFICVPISIGKEVIGAISVDKVFDESASDESASLEEDKRLLSIVDTTVLIRGESGTGKELVAHAIHYSSPRAKGPFVKVNCAALNENLLDSELFGHEKGAFTGAIQSRKGRIEEADGGTLFLDEIGEFSPATQVKLLGVLQDRQFERVGSNKTLRTNARIIVATNRDLEEAVRQDRFRQDLYYRINVFPIFLPPLRERKDDILQLADHFVEQYAARMGREVRRISTPAINMMVAYHWPGNVRELENCIERAVLISTDNVIHGHHLPPTLQTSDASDTIGTGSLEERVDLFARDLIVDALKRCNGNLAATARDLGTTARIIRYKVSELGIDYRRYRREKQL